MAGLSSKIGNYKPLRPSQILKTEEMVTNAIDIITSEYINPFGANIDVNHLYNLSSDVAVEDTLAVEILNLEKKGSELANKFKSERMLIGSNNKKLHDPFRYPETKEKHSQTVLKLV